MLQVILFLCVLCGASMYLGQIITDISQGRGLHWLILFVGTILGWIIYFITKGNEKLEALGKWAPTVFVIIAMLIIWPMLPK